MFAAMMMWEKLAACLTMSFFVFIIVATLGGCDDEDNKRHNLVVDALAIHNQRIEIIEKKLKLKVPEDLTVTFGKRK